MNRLSKASFLVLVNFVKKLSELCEKKGHTIPASLRIQDGVCFLGLRDYTENRSYEQSGSVDWNLLKKFYVIWEGGGFWDS